MTDGEERCYFCRRTWDECREYAEGLREEFLNGPPYSATAGGEWSEEEKASITEQFERLAGRGMYRLAVGRISLPVRGVGYITVPCCPLCNDRLQYAVGDALNDVNDRISDLEERLEEHDL